MLKSTRKWLHEDKIETKLINISKIMFLNTCLQVKLKH